MQVSSITNNIHQNNQTAFKAVNQEYYKKALEDIKICGEVGYNLYYTLSCKVTLYKSISPQDGLDTIKAIREIDKSKYNKNVIAELVGEFKELVKKEWREQRRLDKKIKGKR